MPAARVYIFGLVRNRRLTYHRCPPRHSIISPLFDYQEYNHPFASLLCAHHTAATTPTRHHEVRIHRRCLCRHRCLGADHQAVGSLLPEAHIQQLVHRRQVPLRVPLRCCPRDTVPWHFGNTRYRQEFGPLLSEHHGLRGPGIRCRYSGLESQVGGGRRWDSAVGVGTHDASVQRRHQRGVDMVLAEPCWPPLCRLQQQRSVHRHVPGRFNLSGCDIPRERSRTPC